MGPITVRQFVILLVVGLTDALIYRFADFTLFLFLAIILTMSGIALAFVKINGRPFHYFLLNFTQTVLRPALRIWNKELTSAELAALMEKPPAPPPPSSAVKRLPTATRLSEIALMVNTGGAFSPED